MKNNIEGLLKGSQGLLIELMSSGLGYRMLAVTATKGVSRETL